MPVCFLKLALPGLTTLAGERPCRVGSQHGVRFYDLGLRV